MEERGQLLAAHSLDRGDVDVGERVLQLLGLHQHLLELHLLLRRGRHASSRRRGRPAARVEVAEVAHLMSASGQCRSATARREERTSNVGRAER